MFCFFHHLDHRFDSCLRKKKRSQLPIAHTLVYICFANFDWSSSHFYRYHLSLSERWVNAKNDETSIIHIDRPAACSRAHIKFQISLVCTLFRLRKLPRRHVDPIGAWTHVCGAFGTGVPVMCNSQLYMLFFIRFQNVQHTISMRNANELSSNYYWIYKYSLNLWLLVDSALGENLTQMTVKIQIKTAMGTWRTMRHDWRWRWNTYEIHFVFFYSIYQNKLFNLVGDLKLPVGLSQTGKLESATNEKVEPSRTNVRTKMKFYGRVTFRRKWIAMQLWSLHGVTNETNKWMNRMDKRKKNKCG